MNKKSKASKVTFDEPCISSDSENEDIKKNIFTPNTFKPSMKITRSISRNNSAKSILT